MFVVFCRLDVGVWTQFRKECVFGHTPSSRAVAQHKREPNRVLSPVKTPQDSNQDPGGPGDRVLIGRAAEKMCGE